MGFNDPVNFELNGFALVVKCQSPSLEAGKFWPVADGPGSGPAQFDFSQIHDVKGAQSGQGCPLLLCSGDPVGIVSVPLRRWCCLGLLCVILGPQVELASESPSVVVQG